MIEKIRYYDTKTLSVKDAIEEGALKSLLREGYCVRWKGETKFFETETEACSYLFKEDPKAVMYYLDCKKDALTREIRSLKSLCRNSLYSDYFERLYHLKKETSHREYVRKSMILKVESLFKPSGEVDFKDLPYKKLLEMIKTWEVMRVKKIQVKLAEVRERRRKLHRMYINAKLLFEKQYGK